MLFDPETEIVARALHESIERDDPGWIATSVSPTDGQAWYREGELCCSILWVDPYGLVIAFHFDERRPIELERVEAGRQLWRRMSNRIEKTASKS